MTISPADDDSGRGPAPALRLVCALVAVVTAGLTAAAAPASATSRRTTVALSPTVVTGTVVDATVTESPPVADRLVVVWARTSTSAWTRLARRREPRSGRTVLTLRFPRSGTWTIRIRLHPRGTHGGFDLPDRTVRSRPATRPVVMAHRGGAGEAPENTMAAFRNAVAGGSRVLEADVQATSDGVLVLEHDVDLARTTNVADVFPDRVHDPVGSFTSADLRRLTVIVDPGAPQPIATFDQLLGLVKDEGVSLLAESKHPDGSPGIEAQMLASVGDVGLHSSRSDTRVVYESFHLDSLREFRRLDADANVSAIFNNPPADLAPLTWLDSVTVGSTTIRSSWVADAHRLGLVVNVYAPDTEAEDLAVADAGVDGLITDLPRLALDVLR